MTLRSCRTVLALVAGCAWLAAPADADVLVVSASGAYPQIQQAVDAASDGDAIVVRLGTYAGFTVDGKALQIVGLEGQDPNGQTIQPRVDGTVILRNLPKHGALVLSGLRVVAEFEPPDFQPANVALRIEACLGDVRVEDCRFTGGWGGYTLGNPGGAGAHVSSSLRVAFNRCSFIGGLGSGDGFIVFHGGPGGPALQTLGSAVGLYDCHARGGQGGPPDGFSSQGFGGNGGAGCRVQTFGVFASGTTFQGGQGGQPPGLGQKGHGGHGLLVETPAQAQLLDCALLGGTGLTSGQGLFGGGFVHQFPGSARKLTASSRVLPEGTSMTLTYQGVPGDEVWILRAMRPGHRFVPQVAGMWLVPYPTPMTLQPAGTADGGGTFVTSVGVGDLPPGPGSSALFAQAFVRASDGTTRLSSGVHGVVLDCSELLPDCNGNGSFDLCDLILGTSHDGDGNGVPDECDPSITWHVDAGAPAGGDGSAGLPFRSLAEAFSAAGNGDTVLVGDGLYAGPDNRGLDFGTRQLTVRSQNGAAACVIDCELAGRAFRIASGQTAASSVQGLTILRGSALAGGAIQISSASPRILDCDFRACEATYGGALDVSTSTAVIRGCRFEGNVAQSNGGGIHFLSSASPPLVQDCSFIGNTAQRGGGVYLFNPSPARLDHCVFLGNVALDSGGAFLLDAHFVPIHELRIDHVLLAGNTAPSGGGGALRSNGPTVATRITSSVFVSNLSSLQGGGLHVTNGTVAIENVVAWDNAAPVGASFSIVGGSLAIDYTDLQGGLAGIHGPALVVWGAGNIDLDPLFADPDGPDGDPATLLDNDWRLGPLSPCIDAGNNAAVALDDFDLDGDGNHAEPVPFDLDFLARFIDDPLVPDTGAGSPPIVDLGPYERP